MMGYRRCVGGVLRTPARSMSSLPSGIRSLSSYAHAKTPAASNNRSPLFSCPASNTTPGSVLFHSYPRNEIRPFSEKPLHSKDTDETIAKMRALKKLGSSGKEVETWLSMYESVDTSRFAVFKVGGGILMNDMDNLCSSIQTLTAFGLKPIIVHGSGPQLNDRLRELGIVSQYHEGLRITTPEILSVARKVFSKSNYQLVSELEKRGVRARPIQSGVFTAEMYEEGKLGLVGEVTEVNIESVEEAVEAGCVPVLTCIGQTSDGQFLNINADTSASELAKTLKPLKVVYLSTNGGLLDENGSVIQSIDIHYDFDHLMNQPWMKHGDRRKLIEIRDLMLNLPTSSTVTITSPKLVAKELLTHSLSGTLITNTEKFQRYTSLEGLDQDRMKQLIEAAFRKELRPDFFESIKDKIHSIYLSDLYHGMAILTKEVSDEVPYMSKFAVSESNQMSGLGSRMWKHITEENSSLIWRSRSTNTINRWYFSRSHGTSSNDKWCHFWYGLNLSQAKELVEKCGYLLEDLRKPTEKAPERPALVKKSPKKFGGREVDEIAHDEPFSVGIIGARGYTGSELIKLIDRHPNLKLEVAASRAQAGNPVASVIPGFSDENLIFSNPTPREVRDQNSGIDVWVLAMPNNMSSVFVDALNEDLLTGSKIVDLSADHRFNSDWTYGLPEIRDHRHNIRVADRIANPGCYATAAITSTLPLLKWQDGKTAEGFGNGLLASAPNFFGVSGYSGAGTTPSPKNDPMRLHNNMMAYSLQNHMHEKEVSHVLKAFGSHKDGVRFTPHVGAWFRGIHMTIQLELTKELSAEDIMHLYRSYYADEKAVVISNEIPEVKDIVEQPLVTIGGFAVHDRRLVLVSTIDNLSKGAATQCMQNINLCLGLNEFESIFPSEDIDPTGSFDESS